MNATASQIDLLARVLDAAGLRHRAITQNLANLNTPFYRRLDVEFEEEVRQRLGGASPASAAQVTPRMVETDELPTRADGNTVTLERELGLMSKNTLLYNTAAQILATRLATQRFAINGR